MTSNTEPVDLKLIWATRGRTWGFRFLRDGGFKDPLPQYELAFEGSEAEPTLILRNHRTVALRFPDPKGRTDSSGRVIPHEFVIFEPEASRIGSFEEAFQMAWNAVAKEFEQVWNDELP